MSIQSSKEKIAKLAEQIKLEEQKMVDKGAKLFLKSGILEVDINEKDLVKELKAIAEKYKKKT